MSLINFAYADTKVATASGANSTDAFINGLKSYLPLVIIFALFWFLIIRPQQKKAKLHNQMLSALKAGDEVTTTSGMLGKIVKVTDSFIVLEVANNVNINVQKSAITNKVESGTISKI